MKPVSIKLLLLFKSKDLGSIPTQDDGFSEALIFLLSDKGMQS